MLHVLDTWVAEVHLWLSDMFLELRFSEAGVWCVDRFLNVSGITETFCTSPFVEKGPHPFISVFLTLYSFSAPLFRRL
jgi:hypothetical protein